MNTLSKLFFTARAGTMLMGTSNSQPAEATNFKIKHVAPKPNVKIKPRIKVRLKAPKVRITPKKLRQHRSAS
ncbi:MAG: hypothetical protein ACR2O8_10360 [Rhizobiaceae bacterium]